MEFGGCTWDVGAKTDQGKERENNEDRLLFAPERGLFVVCDGMGGMAAGEKAAEQAVASFERECSTEALDSHRRQGAETLTDFLKKTVYVAHEDIRTLQQERRFWKKMGCTVVASALLGSSLSIANLGDSRAYLIRVGESEPCLLTIDHTVAAELVRLGDMTPEVARHHNLRNELTSALGHLDQHYPPLQTTVALQAGDRVVLCSDGLWDMVADAEIARLTLEASSAPAAVESLIDAANEAGGSDNITVIVLHLLESSSVSSHGAEPQFDDPNKTVQRNPEQNEKGSDNGGIF